MSEQEVLFLFVILTEEKTFLILRAIYRETPFTCEVRDPRYPLVLLMLYLPS